MSSYNEDADRKKREAGDLMHLQKGGTSYSTQAYRYSSMKPWKVSFWCLLILSVITRFWGLHLPKHVCWDETHFGKFVNHYLHGKFYFDVHPPFGKMLLAVVGALSGYKGNFEFKKPGQPFPEDMVYTPMRGLCAAFGAGIPVLVFGIMYDMGFHIEAAVITALLVICDTGISTITRYILLDAQLLFMITLSLFCYCRFLKHAKRPFSSLWWKWMAYTGAALGCTMCTKWVGAFIVAFIGVSTILELWEILGNLNLSLKTVANHFWARVLCLIVIPVTIYVFFFWIHFMWVSGTGPGDGFMSSKFQTSLRGNVLNRMKCPKNIAIGSQFSLKSYRLSGGLLHSHPDTYPKEVSENEQQQVTTYMHKDGNNDWVLHSDTDDYVDDPQNPTFLMHGDYIRFTHKKTERNLHSHDVKAPITNNHKQVSCYGNAGKGDSNDIWQVLIDGLDPPKEGEERGPKIEIISTIVKLRHKGQNCYLHQGGNNLPKWGFEQGEVTCNPEKNDPNNLWNLETIVDERLEKIDVSKKYRPSFFQSLVELHVVMANVNNNMIPKPNEQVSRPWHWPVLKQGQHFTPWGENDQRVFLMGNPVIWFSNLIFILLFSIASFIFKVVEKRGYDNPFYKGRNQKLSRYGGWILFGFFLHYIPFFAMSRVLYFHHYFPSLIFNFILSGIVIDELLFWVWYIGHKRGLTKRVIHGIVGTVVLILLYSLYYFSPFVYGMTGPKKNYSNLKWRKGWSI